MGTDDSNKDGVKLPEPERIRPDGEVDLEILEDEPEDEEFYTEEPEDMGLEFFPSSDSMDIQLDASIQLDSGAPPGDVAEDPPPDSSPELFPTLDSIDLQLDRILGSGLHAAAGTAREASEEAGVEGGPDAAEVAAWRAEEAAAPRAPEGEYILSPVKERLQDDAPGAEDQPGPPASPPPRAEPPPPQGAAGQPAARDRAGTPLLSNEVLGKDVLARINLRSVVLGEPEPPAEGAEAAPAPDAGSPLPQERVTLRNHDPRLEPDPGEEPERDFDRSADWLTRTLPKLTIPRSLLEPDSEPAPGEEPGQVVGERAQGGGSQIDSITGQFAVVEFDDEHTEAIKGFDQQDTIRVSRTSVAEAEQRLAAAQAGSLDPRRLQGPSAYPPLLKLDEATQQKVRETGTLFHSLSLTLHTFWADGTSQAADGQNQPLDMSLVGGTLEWLQDLLKRRGKICLEVTPYELLMFGRRVLGSEISRKNPFYRLYYEGIRELWLLPGIVEEEFTELFRLLTWNPSADADRDAPTLLWELDLPHLKVRSAGGAVLFPEGDGLDPGPRRELVRRLSKSLHGEQTFSDPSQPFNEESDDLLDRVLRLRLDLARLLGQEASEEAAAALRVEVERLEQSHLERGLWVLLQLSAAAGQSKPCTAALRQLTGSLLERGQWDELSRLAELLKGVLSPESPEPIRRNAALLRAGLGKVLTPQRLLLMGPRLGGMTLKQFHRLRNLLCLLPKEATDGMGRLLDHLPPGAVQGAMQDLLKERGINLELFHTRRLLSDDENEVITGIAMLQDTPTEEALDAIRSTLSNPSPRVRMRALQALTGHLSPALIPDLVDCLESSPQELRELCFDLLDQLPQDRAARALLPNLEALARGHGTESWGKADRRRALRLLILSGDEECKEFLVGSIIARNLLNAADVEEFRKEVLDALVEVGGRGAYGILALCDKHWTFGNIRAAIQDALDRLGSRR